MKPVLDRLIGLLHRQDVLSETVRNAAGVFAIRFGGALTNFLFTLVVVRFLPKEQVGFALVTISMVQIAALFATLNIESGAVRHLLHPLEQGREEEAAGFVRYGMAMIVRMSLFVLPAFLLWAWLVHFGSGNIYRTEIIAIACAALAIPLIALMRLIAQSAHAMSRIVTSMLPQNLIQPMFMVSLTAVAGIVLERLSVGRVLLFYLLAVVFALLLQILLNGGAFGFLKAKPDMRKAAEWRHTGLYLSITILLLNFFPNVVLVVAALGLDDAALALLAIAFRFGVLLRMGGMAINSAISPSISKAVVAGDVSFARHQLHLAAHLKFWPTLILTLIVWWLAPWLITIPFGTEYADAAWLLRFIAIIPLASAFFGPSIMMLNITGHQKAVFPASALSLALLAVSVPVTSLLWGATGAAIAATVCVVLWEAALYVRVHLQTEYDPSILGATGLWRERSVTSLSTGKH